MKGFRSGEFTGVDQPPKGFIPLRERDIGLEQLISELWTPAENEWAEMVFGGSQNHPILTRKQAGNAIATACVAP